MTIHKLAQRCVLFIVPFLAISHGVSAIERRNKTADDEISYFVYPLVYKVPGLGSGDGVGGTVVNLLGDGSTLSLLRIQGEIGVDSIIASDIPLFTEHLTLSAAYADGTKGGFAFYDRGSDAAAEPEFILEFERSWARGFDIGLNFFDKKFEVYFGAAYAYPEIDYEKNFTENFDDISGLTLEEQEAQVAAFTKNVLKYYDLVKVFVSRSGLNLDWTDDRIDPRVGVRFQYESYGFKGDGMTNFKVEDYSMTAYIPNADLSTVLVANAFFSTSETLKELDMLSEFEHAVCVEETAQGRSPENEAAVSSATICRGMKQGIDDSNENEARNSNATSLGGPNRLRSYPISRFYDTHSFFAGLEYRMYFAENSTPFNLILEKGVFEAVQLALFYEVGQVSPVNDSSLFQDLKYSAGVGLRLVFSAVVLRADFATGEEGSETTVFIGYGF